MAKFTILDEVITTTTSTGDFSGLLDNQPDRVFQAFGQTSAGVGSATIEVQVSADNVNWLDTPLATITLTLGTTTVTEGFSTNSQWAYVRGEVTAISGTDATVSLIGVV